MTNNDTAFNDTMTDIALNLADAASPQSDDATDELIHDFDMNLELLRERSLADDELIVALQRAMNLILPEYDNFNE